MRKLLALARDRGASPTQRDAIAREWIQLQALRVTAYRSLVALERQAITAYGKPEALRPGMLVDADILGEKRKLYEWVLEPLYSVQGKLD